MKKILAMILALCMMLTMVPALAESTTPAGSETPASEGLGALLGGLMSGAGEGGEGSGLGALLGGLMGGGKEGGSLSNLIKTLLEKLKESGIGAKLSALLGQLTSGSGLSGLLGGLTGGNGEGSGMDLSGLLGGLKMTDETETTEELPEAAEDAAGTEAAGTEPTQEEVAEFLNGLMTMFTAHAQAPANAVKADSMDQFVGVWKLASASANGEEIALTEIVIPDSDMTDLLTITDSDVYFLEAADAAQQEAEAIELAEGGLFVTDDGVVISMYLTEAGQLYVYVGGLEMLFDSVQ